MNCPFYIKVGACRFGDRCSRRHPIPSSSSTLLIRGMFSDMSLAGQLPLDEQDQDLSLEVLAVRATLSSVLYTLPL